MTFSDSILVMRLAPNKTPGQYVENLELGLAFARVEDFVGFHLPDHRGNGRKKEWAFYKFATDAPTYFSQGPEQLWNKDNTKKMSELAAANGVDDDRLVIGKHLPAKGNQKERVPKDFRLYTVGKLAAQVWHMDRFRLKLSASKVVCCFVA